MNELTKTEREIASQIVLGKTNREIAAELFVAPSTVKSHVSSIYRKTGINNRVRLATFWQQSQGVVQCE